MISYSGSDQTLRTHLAKKHGLLDHLYPSQKKSYINSKGRSKFNPNKKKLFDQMIFDCIVDDSMAFGAFNKPGMVKLFAAMTPDYKVPSRQRCARNLRKMHKQFLGDLKKVLEMPRHIALTSDLWESRSGW